MSLEQALAENTAAVTALTAAFRGATTLGATAPAEKTPTGKKATTKTAVTTPKDPTPPTTSGNAAIPGLKQVTDIVLDFAAENSAKAKEILKSFGVSRITELKPVVYNDVLAAVAKAKEAIAADLLTGNDDVDSLV